MKHYQNPMIQLFFIGDEDILTASALNLTEVGEPIQENFEDLFL